MLTAFLLLTSIIIVGGLGAFLVLDEVDAGTLTALRVTPVPLRDFFAYRAATVMVVTTGVCDRRRCRSAAFSSRVLVPALIPIGLLAGLSAVVSLLLIVAVASNKIQGLAMVRALGMLIAGLPCLPWFIDSGWNLAFGVLPPYWAAKAFWVASDHGTWWPYLVGGADLQPRRGMAAVPPLHRQERQPTGEAMPAHREPNRTMLSSKRSRAMPGRAAPGSRRT